MRGIHIFEKPYYREIRPMRGPPVGHSALKNIIFFHAHTGDV